MTMAKPIKLKKQEVIDALNNKRFTQDKALTELGSGKAFVSEKGEVLFVFEDGKGIMYESLEMLNDILFRAEQQVNRSNIFDSLPFVESFIENIQARCESLSSLLDIPEITLDKSEDSLNAVEEAVKKVG